MMDLKAMAAQLIADGFKQGDKVQQGFDELPDGEYDAVLANVEWRTSESGFEWLSLQFDILNDGFENRKYFGMISFSNEKMAQMNMKLALNSLKAVGVEKEQHEFIALFERPEVNLVEAFQEGLGSQVALTLKGWENKKTGKKGQNFTVGEPVPF